MMFVTGAIPNIANSQADGEYPIRSGRVETLLMQKQVDA
jgi:hypothetical protein